MDMINRPAGVTLGKDDGVLHNVTPAPLKEQFLKMLESKVDVLEEMLNILKIEGTATQYPTVRELVRSYEKCYGQLCLDEWKNILAHVGFGKYYHQCLADHQRDMASAVSSWTPPIVNTQATCKPSSGAIPKKQSTQKQLHKADDHEQTHTGSETQVVVTKDFSLSQLPVHGLEATMGERDQEKLEKNCQSLNSEFPPQSLPLTDENVIEDVAKGRRSCVNSSMAIGCHPEESGCPAENDERLDRDTRELIKKTHEMYITKEKESSKQLAEYIQQQDEPIDRATVQVDMLNKKNEKLFEMYLAKEKECKKFVEHIKQQDERNDRATVQVDMLKKENEELSEELHSVFGKMETQRLVKEKKLQEEIGKLQNWKKEKAEMFEEFRHSERKKVKTMEVKLTKEKRKVKRIKMQVAREKGKRKRMERELAKAKSKGGMMEKRNKKKMESLKRNESFLVQKMESLKRNESFLVQELREKTVQLDNCQTQYTHLQQDLEEFRAGILAELQSVQTSNAEWQRRFEESRELIAKAHEMCRKATQMYLWKEQECERMKEHIAQHDQKYDKCNEELRNLGKEFEERQEELHSAFEMAEELRLDYDNKRKLLEEREVDLDRRMAEMSQAFCNAETDRIKIMKVKLAEETRKRNKMKRQLTKERSKRKRVELEKAIEKRRGKRMEKRKKDDRCQGLRKGEKGDGPSGDPGGGYEDHVSRDDGELSRDGPSGNPGGGYRGHVSRDDGELSRDGPSGGIGGDYGGHVSRDDGELSRDGPSGDQGGGYGGHVSRDDGKLSRDGPSGGPGGGYGGHMSRDDGKLSRDGPSGGPGGGYGGHMSRDDGELSRDGPSGDPGGGYRGHVSRDDGELSIIASSEEEASEREVTTCPDGSIENEDTRKMLY